MVSLTRNSKYIEDIQKQMYKFQGDFANYQNVVDNTFRTTNTSIDGVRYDLAKTQRDHEADQLRLDRMGKIIEKFEREFSAYQTSNLETLAMHGEEIETKIHSLDKRIVKDNIRIGEIEYSHEKIAERFSECLETQERTKVDLSTLR
jgi:conjugal transfer/entry exclusion protein